MSRIVELSRMQHERLAAYALGLEHLLDQLRADLAIATVSARPPMRCIEDATALCSNVECSRNGCQAHG